MIKTTGGLVGGSAGLLASYLFRPNTGLGGPSLDEWLIFGSQQKETGSTIMVCAGLGFFLGVLVAWLIESIQKKEEKKARPSAKNWAVQGFVFAPLVVSGLVFAYHNPHPPPNVPLLNWPAAYFGESLVWWVILAAAGGALFGVMSSGCHRASDRVENHSLALLFRVLAYPFLAMRALACAFGGAALGGLFGHGFQNYATGIILGLFLGLAVDRGLEQELDSF